MTFWALAIAIPLLTALLLFRPLLRHNSGFLALGLALLLLIPVSSLLMYQGVGTPEGILVTGAPAPVAEPSAEEMDMLLAQLEARMEEQPNDVEGWMLLGRSYKSLQRYNDALYALQQAHRVVPDDPVVAVELAEAMIFTSGPEGPGATASTLLDEALARDSSLQKGLWLAGMVAMQDGRDADAVAYWEPLMQQLQPGSNVASSVQQQLDAAYVRLGVAPPEIAPADDWAGFEVTVTLDGVSGPLPEQSALFVIARDPSAPNPPLGAVRIPQPGFPLTVNLSDANSMLPRRPISGAVQVEVLARLSMNGQPLPGEGDLQSPVQMVSPSHGGAILLELPALP